MSADLRGTAASTGQPTRDPGAFGRENFLREGGKMEKDEIKALLQQLIESTNRTMQSHKAGLDRMKTDIAELRALLTNHKRGIDSHEVLILRLCDKAGIVLATEDGSPDPGAPVN